LSAEVQEQPQLPLDEERPQDEGALVADPPRDEVERIIVDPKNLKLKSGLEIELEALKLRQFLAMIRILTRGAAGALASGALANSRDTDSFIRELLSMLLFSIPEAEEETVDFLKSMVVVKREPIDSDEVFEEKKTRLSEELDNPELEDTITICEAMLVKEGHDLRALGNRLATMMQVATKMGVTKKK
jgi:hypothetical protein